MRINLKLQNLTGELVFRKALNMANSSARTQAPRRYPEGLCRVGMKFDQQAFHDYDFFLISSSQSKSNASSSSSDKVKRDFLERLNLSVDPSN